MRIVHHNAAAAEMNHKFRSLSANALNLLIQFRKKGFQPFRRKGTALRPDLCQGLAAALRRIDDPAMHPLISCHKCFLCVEP